MLLLYMSEYAVKGFSLLISTNQKTVLDVFDGRHPYEG